MRQFIIPIILVALSIGIFVIYTNPTYQSSKSTQAEVAAYNDALNKSQELRQTRDAKVAAYNTFSPDDTKKLNQILPDNVDNIHLIIDINNIAARHGLTLKDVTLGTISDSKAEQSAIAVGASGSAVGSVDLGFTVSASYDDFLALLTDLEHSLRVMDVEKISFTAPDSSAKGPASDLTDYAVSVRTYWLH